MSYDIVIREDTVSPSRREALRKADVILRKHLMRFSEEDLHRGRRILLFLKFRPSPERAVQCGEFTLGGMPREDVSADALDREITEALVRGGI